MEVGDAGRHPRNNLDLGYGKCPFLKFAVPLPCLARCEDILFQLYLTDDVSVRSIRHRETVMASSSHSSTATSHVRCSIVDSQWSMPSSTGCTADQRDLMHRPARNPEYPTRSFWIRVSTPRVSGVILLLSMEQVFPGRKAWSSCQPDLIQYFSLSRDPPKAALHVLRENGFRGHILYRWPRAAGL